MSIFKEEALPFITYNPETRKYALNEEVAAIIRQVPKPIGIISVAGAYRTGKSYLLNRMILNRNGGFGVGPTVNPCTKGIWMWGTPIKGQTAEGDPVNLLIMDSEGIGSTDEDQTHDTRVFSLAILLASNFIYNSMGSIDENALNNLSLVVNLTKNIHVKSSDGSEDVGQEDYSKYFPSFFWVIRDFSLQLVDTDGEPITSNEYLERSLQEQKGISDEVESKNRIRRLLTTFFQQRECMTLVRPLVNEKNLQKLDEMELDDLRPEFFEQVLQLRKRILNRIKPKTLNGKQLNGEMVMTLCDSYVRAINNGAVPNIENAWTYVCKDECYKAGQKAFETYEKTLKELIAPKIPTTNEELKACHKIAKENALEIYKKRAIGDVSKDHQEELLRKIKARITQVKSSNEKESVNECTAFIQREFATIERKLKSNQYKKFADFESDIKLFYGFLVTHGPATVNRNLVFLEFLQKAINDAANIFTKNLEQEIDIQRSCNSEVQKRSDSELSEIKKKGESERQIYDRRIEQLIREKDSALNDKSKNEKAAKESEESKAKIERELKEQLQTEKAELFEQIQSLRGKFKTCEESLKKVERDLLLKESSFQKEKALLEQRALHFESLCDEYQTRDKANENTLQSTHSGFSSQLKENTGKYERVIKDLETKLSNLRDTNADLLEKLSHQADNFAGDIGSQQQRERALTKQIEELQQDVALTKKQLSEVSSNGLKNLGDLKDHYNDEFQELKNQNSMLNEELSRSQERHKSEMSELRKKEALLSQQVEFVRHELEESRSQLVDVKKSHESTLQALEMNSFGDSESVSNKQYVEMKETHMRQLKAIENEALSNKKGLISQIESLTKELQELELKSKMQQHDSIAEITSLQDELAEVTAQKDIFGQKLNESEELLKLSSQDMEKKYIRKIRELEDLVEAIKDRASSEIREIQQKSEENLQQLKNMFEIEKETLEKRLIEEKEKREKNYNAIVEEYEQKLRDEQSVLEEEIENLRDDIKEYEIQVMNMQGQYEHELDMKSKTIDNLEKVLSEIKLQLQNSSAQYQSQLDTQMASYNSDRKELQSKYEIVQRNLQLQENKCLSLAQKLETSESSLDQKKKEMIILRQEAISERVLTEEKLEETRKKYQELSDEHLQTKIHSEKGIALASQQNEFFQKKVIELEKQLETATTRYEERMKLSKSEWLSEMSEKMSQLTDEKTSLEMKLNQLKKQTKENEVGSAKKIADLEKDKAIAGERITFIEGKLRENEEKFIQEIEDLKESLGKSKEFTSIEKKCLIQEIDKLKSTNVVLDNEKHELTTSYERDKVLWEGKFAFLQQQKEQAKLDLIEAQKKFESTLTHLQKQRQNEKSEREHSATEMLMQIERKYQVQITELQDSSNVKLAAANQKITRLEAELKNYSDNSFLESRSKSSNAMYTEKRINELLESEKKYNNELETLRRERDAEKTEAQRRLDQERDTLKQKIIQIEEKFREADKKRNGMIFEHEKERAKWNLEKDHLINSKSEVIENLNKTEKKKDNLLRENEKLKNDARQSRRQLINNNQPSFLNMSRNMSERKSPLRSARSRERSSINDYSYASHGADLENDNGSDTNTNNILDNLNLNNSREMASNLISQQVDITTSTFKSFVQVMQEKSGSLSSIPTSFYNENKPPGTPQQ